MKHILTSIYLLLTTFEVTMALDSMNVVHLTSIQYNQVSNGGLSLSNELLAVCLRDSGLMLLDVSDPFNPQHLSIYRSVDAIDIEIKDSLAFIADPDSGLIIINVSDVDNPESLGKFNVGSSVFSLDVQDGLAYLAATRIGLRVIDVTEPDEPHEIGSFIGNNYSFNVSVFGDLAFVSKFSSLSVIDVTNPERPRELSIVPLTSISHVDFHEDILYVADGSDGLKIYNLIDIEDIRLVSRYATRDFAVSVSVKGIYAYIADSEDGFSVLDIRDLDNITEVGYYNTEGTAQFLALGDSGLVFVSDYTNLGIYRFTPPAEESAPKFSLYPSSFILYPSYPNPFNSSVTLSYRLDRRSPVSVRIYDAAGHEVSSLFNGIVAPGTHNLVWNAGDMPGGVYMGRMEAGDYSRSVKMMLVR